MERDPAPARAARTLAHVRRRAATPAGESMAAPPPDPRPLYAAAGLVTVAAGPPTAPAPAPGPASAAKAARGPKVVRVPLRLRVCTDLGPCPSGSGCAETRRTCLKGLFGGTVRHLGECQGCEQYVARPPRS